MDAVELEVGAFVARTQSFVTHTVCLQTNTSQGARQRSFKCQIADRMSLPGIVSYFRGLLSSHSRPLVGLGVLLE